MKKTKVTSDTKQKPEKCKYFLNCNQPAVTVIPNHPILGDVPACARCNAKYYAWKSKLEGGKDDRSN